MSFVFNFLLLAVLCCSLVASKPAYSLESRSSTDWSFNRTACQYPTSDPLTGCPQGTLLVGPSANFTTVQSAVASLSNSSSSNPHVILILPGNYTEQVNVTSRTPVYLLGQTANPYNQSTNTVNIKWAAIAGNGDNAYTATLTVAPNLDAALTGSGTTGHAVPADNPYGCTDFRAYNIEFINDYAPYSDGPSLALSMGYANAGFYYCGFWSYQDTIYVGKLGNAYMYKSLIAGQTDFFYGFGTAWIQSCEILLRSCGGGITAWKGTDTTFVNKYGVYIHESGVRKENSSLSIEHKCPLGRPWNSLHRSIFSLTNLDNSILPAGYIDWSSRTTNETFMAEYNNTGPGFNLTARLEGNITKELTSAQWEPYSSPEKVFNQNGTSWIDWDA
ncbi:MAG: hypothetical protein M1834_000613 [Cirrosporium novae-zelandiae]|nr:MAG: hypothetical protein M1834_000613 [Cirrosporium novae-zelandiae]